MTTIAYQSKYHIGLDSVGYILAQKKGIKYYQKKKAPEFVGKFGSGDSSYRDNTFWQFFVQTNWRNGSKQLKFDDPGKFWKSENVDTSQLEKLTLSPALVSVGQVASGVKVNCMEAWRSSTSWWDANYGYRQQITVTAPSDKQVPVGYPVKVTIDTAALQTAAKVRSDRKDWRIVYWNGSSWVDLLRDYVSGSITFFPLQAAVSASASDSNYYAYYGYSSESTTKQPSSEAEWNTVYFGTTFDDGYVVGLYHMREGTGATVNDDSSHGNTGTNTGTYDWSTNNKIGRGVNLEGAGQNDYIDLGNSADFNLYSLTIEMWVEFDAIPNDGQSLCRKQGEAGQNAPYYFGSNGNQLTFSYDTGGGGAQVTGATALSTGTLYHVAAYYDGTNVKVFLNGVQDGTAALNTGQRTSAQNVQLGRDLNGKIYHTRISNGARSSFPHALATQPTTAYGTEITTQPPSSSFDLYAGASNGKIYKWDGTTTWTEQFDVKKVESYETGGDNGEPVGDVGGTEYAAGQGFQLTATQVKSAIKSVGMYLKKGVGTPGAITVTIETDNAGKPSGTLAHANATTTIAAFTETDYAWKEAIFANTFTLTATTLYWIVLKTAAAANDNYYSWQSDASTPGYTNGTFANSANGGSTWSAVAGTDAYFRTHGNTTSVNCMKVTSVGGTQKLYVGTGDPLGQVNGDARLVSYDGSTWAIPYIFNTTTESMINSIEEFVDSGKVYLGVGPQAKIYETANFTAFTLSKDINVPQNPGYIYAMKEYNSVLYAGGGSPEFLPEQYYNGFLNYYDSTKWRQLYPFDFTVIKSLEFYDAYLFMGTYHGHLYVFDTSSLNPLFNFKDDYGYKVQISTMKYFDDKLYLGLYPQASSNETNVGLWKFDRRGLTLANTVVGVAGYRCMAVVNGSLFVGTGDNGYIYKLDPNTFNTQGWYQSSYFDANLPNYDKLYESVTIKTEPLISGESVVIYYRYFETDSWITLGTFNTVGETVSEIKFPAGTNSKKISLKIELNTTDASKTPTVTEVIMKYTLYPVRKWQWNIRLALKENIHLLDDSLETRTAAQMRTALEGLLTDKTLFTFVDVDGTSYNVMVVNQDQASWVINQDTTNEDEINLTLLEA